MCRQRARTKTHFKILLRKYIEKKKQPKKPNSQSKSKPESKLSITITIKNNYYNPKKDIFLPNINSWGAKLVKSLYIIEHKAESLVMKLNEKRKKIKRAMKKGKRGK